MRGDAKLAIISLLILMILSRILNQLLTAPFLPKGSWLQLLDRPSENPVFETQGAESSLQPSPHKEES